MDETVCLNLSLRTINNSNPLVCAIYCRILTTILNLIKFQENFCLQFKDVHDEREKFWWNSILYTTLGLGTLAAMLYVKS